MGHLVDTIMSKGHMLVDKLFAPEVAMYNWVHKKIFGGGDAPAADNASAEAVNLHELKDGQYHFVDFFAQACPHCVDLAPKWKQAADQWKDQVLAGKDNNDIPNVTFEAKQCLDDNWKPGSAYQECASEQVRAFPTLKLFGPNGQHWDFQGPRTPDNLIKFVKQHTGLEPVPAEDTKAAAAADAAAGAESEHDGPPVEHKAPEENQIVEYFAASCPHCVHLKPAWEDAAQSWEKTHDVATAGAADGEHPTNVKWVAKECLNDQWKPGKDFDDCLREEIQAFPTVKFEGKGGRVEEYMGPRTKDGLHKFAEQQLKASENDVVPTPAPAKAGGTAGDKAADAAKVEEAVDKKAEEGPVKADDSAKADLGKEAVEEEDGPDEWDLQDDDDELADGAQIDAAEKQDTPQDELDHDIMGSVEMKDGAAEPVPAAAPAIKAASMGDEYVLSNIAGAWQAMFGSEEEKKCNGAVQGAAFF